MCAVLEPICPECNFTLNSATHYYLCNMTYSEKIETLKEMRNRYALILNRNPSEDQKARALKEVEALNHAIALMEEHE